MTSTDDTVREEIRSLLGDLPPTSPIPSGRAVERRRHLESEVRADTPRRRRPRRGVVVGAATGVAVLLAAGSAVAYRAWAPATDTSYAQCFTAASLDALGTTVTEASTGSDARVRAVDAMEACSTIWRTGLLAKGEPGVVDRATLDTDAPVPPLVACRLDNGAAGVFPGDEQTCFELGLPRLASG